MRCSLFVSAAVLCFAGCGRGPAPLVHDLGPVEVRVDRTRAKIAEPIVATVVVSSAEIKWPDWPKQSGDLFLRSATQPVVSETGSSRSYVWDALDSGRQTIPAASIVVNGQTIAIPATPIAVRSAVGWLGSAEFAPAVRDIPVRLPLWGWLVVAFAGAVGGLMLIGRIASWIGGRELPPQVRLQRLAERSREGLSHDEVIREAIAILRAGLEDRGEDNAASMTTGELLETEPVALLDADDFDRLAGVLHAYDALMYARQPPTLADAREAISAVASVVGGKQEAA